MKTKTITNIAGSVKARLLNAARERGCTFNTLLTRYANERFLYRLGKSPCRENLILKGSNLFLIWQQGHPYRPTIDSDFLVMGRTDQDYLKSIFMDICTMPVEIQDGLNFLPDSVEAAEIREENQYGGTRITLTGYLGTAKARLQFDLGIGDVITPSPEWQEYPVVLDFPAPVLRAYPKETAIAEKVKAMVTLGMVNSRMKDFADILVLQRNFDFGFPLLRKAVENTFARYGASMPEQMPVCFSSDFAHSPTKQKQWIAFIGKAEIKDLPMAFPDVVDECSAFLLPLLIPAQHSPGKWIAEQRCWIA